MELQPLSLLITAVVDLALSADNAIVIGLAASTLHRDYRLRAVRWGISVAVVTRVALAVLANELIGFPEIKLVGAVLLVWVCLRLWRDLYPVREENEIAAVGLQSGRDGRPDKGFSRAMLSIVVADISMSLDNVVAVAAIADGNRSTLVFGLTVSILLMAIGATAISSLIGKHRWIGSLGLVLLIGVAVNLAVKGIQPMLS